MGCGAGAARGNRFEGIADVPNFKIVLVGDAGVGKTSVFLRYSHNQFDYNYKPTKRVSIENVVRKLNLPNDAVVSVTLWDVPGSDDVDLRHTYYQNVDALIVVVDLNEADTIEMASTWRQDFLTKASQSLSPPPQATGLETNAQGFDPRTVPMLLLGNKYDLVEDNMKEAKLKKALLKPNDTQEVPESESADEPGNELQDGMRTVELTIEDKPKRNSQEGSEGDEVSLGSTSTSEAPVPKCIELLKHIEASYGFIGSIVVSARNKDWSIHTAIQSLVRHLLEQKGTKPLQKPEVEDVQESKKKEKNKHKKKQLQPIGLPQVDALWDKTRVPYQRLHDYLAYHGLVERRLRQACADQGLLGSSQASLEDCMIALRNTLHQSVGVELKGQEEEGFIQLTYSLPDKERMPMHLDTILHTFQDEYAAVCKALLRDLPKLDALLDKLDAKIVHQMELDMTQPSNNQELSSGKVPITESQRKEMRLICDNNRALLAHSRQQASERVQAVRQSKQKIHNALLW